MTANHRVELGNVSDGVVFLEVARVNDEYRFVAVKETADYADHQPERWAGIISYDMSDRPKTTAVDFVPGGTLASFIDDNAGEPRVRGYDITQKWKIAYDLADQVFRLHKRKVLHRNLKTENVLVDENLLGVIVNYHHGRDLMLDRIDFLRLDAAPVVFWYDPPELQNDKLHEFRNRVHRAMKSGQSHDEVFNTLICKIDVYMFGLLLYELFVETFPFSDQHMDPGQLMMRIESGELSVTFDDPRIPKSVNCPVKDLVNRCTCFDAEDRPTMAEVKEELRNLILDYCDDSDELEQFMTQVDTNPRTPTVHGTLEKLTLCVDKGIRWSAQILDDAMGLWNNKEERPVLHELANA